MTVKIPSIFPKITLVGAGPGDPELITVKGLRALRSARAILYDALVSEELLALAPPGAQLVSVGKRAGRHSFSQEAIHLALVEAAMTYGSVVRLKGGDPFVFGRGSEELAFAEAVGIPTEVIPGLSSCIAVPGLQGVPVTARGVSESFWVLTGTTQRGTLSPDLTLAAQSTATIVILMGLHQLPALVALFSQYGKADVPAMIIQSGSTPQEKVITGKVATLADQFRQEGDGGPGIIIIGEVVNLAISVRRALLAKTQSA